MPEYNGAVTMDYSTQRPVGSLTLADTQAAILSVPAYNVNSSTTSKFRQALSRVNTKTGNAKILTIGDSTMWGLFSGGANGNCPPKILSELLNRNLLPTQYSFIVPVGTSGPTTGTDKDTRIGVDGALPANWGHTAFGFGHSGAWQSAGAGTTSASLDIRPGIECDTFEVFYMNNSGLGTLDLSVDGGSVTVVDCAAGANGIAWKKATITAPAASNHVLSIIKKVNTVFVFGVNAYLSTQKSIQVMNVGMCSSRAYDSGTSWGMSGTGHSLDGISLVAPDITIIQLGINDAVLGTPSSVENWEASIRALITAAKTSGDVILSSVVPSDPSYQSGNAVANEQAYRNRCLTIAKETGCVYFDVFDRFSSWTVANNSGYISDTLHLSNKGSADLAYGYYKLISN